MLMLVLLESTTRFWQDAAEAALLPNRVSLAFRDQKDGHLTISAARPLSKSSRLELVSRDLSRTSILQKLFCFLPNSW